MIRFQVMYL